MNIAKDIAATLLDLEAVSLQPHQPFTWASGLKSPIYCDNRLIISNVAARRQVIEAFAALVREKGYDFDCIAGTATAGIPHAAWLAEKLELPMVYVRSSEKGHGKQNRIEGRLPAKARVLVVEDLISTGGSSVTAAEALVEAGAEISAVVAVFQYGLPKAEARFKEADIAYATLSDFNTLIEVAVEQHKLAESDLALLRSWNQDPKAWSDRVQG